MKRNRLCVLLLALVAHQSSQASQAMLALKELLKKNIKQANQLADGGKKSINMIKEIAPDSSGIARLAQYADKTTKTFVKTVMEIIGDIWLFVSRQRHKDVPNFLKEIKRLPKNEAFMTIKQYVIINTNSTVESLSSLNKYQEKMKKAIESMDKTISTASKAEQSKYIKIQKSNKELSDQINAQIKLYEKQEKINNAFAIKLEKAQQLVTSSADPKVSGDPIQVLLSADIKQYEQEMSRVLSRLSKNDLQKAAVEYYNVLNNTDFTPRALTNDVLGPTKWKGAKATASGPDPGLSLADKVGKTEFDLSSFDANVWSSLNSEQKVSKLIDPLKEAEELSKKPMSDEQKKFYTYVVNGDYDALFKFCDDKQICEIPHSWEVQEAVVNFRLQLCQKFPDNCGLTELAQENFSHFIKEKLPEIRRINQLIAEQTLVKKASKLSKVITGITTSAENVKRFIKKQLFR